MIPLPTPLLGCDHKALRWHHSYVHCSCGTQYQWSMFSVEGESYVLTPYDIITSAVDPPHIRWLDPWIFSWWRYVAVHIVVITHMCHITSTRHNHTIQWWYSNRKDVSKRLHCSKQSLFWSHHIAVALRHYWPKIMSQYCANNCPEQFQKWRKKVSKLSTKLRNLFRYDCNMQNIYWTVITIVPMMMMMMMLLL